VPVFNADTHALSIALTQSYTPLTAILADSGAGSSVVKCSLTPHVRIRFPFVLKIVFFRYFLHFSFIVTCDLFSLTFISIIIKAPLAIARASLRIGSVHLFLRLFICSHKVYTKTRFSQKLSNLEL